jgi:hypothetical protein
MLPYRLEAHAIVEPASAIGAALSVVVSPISVDSSFKFVPRSSAAPSSACLIDLSRILERQKMLQTGQVLLRRLSVNFALVLPFKDSQGGTSSLELSDFKSNSLRSHAPVKKQTQYADRAKAFDLSSNPRSRYKRGG